MPLRIAILAENYGGIGGSERFVKEVTERLAATGKYEFHVFANRWEAGRPDIVFHKVPRIKFPRFLRPWFFTAMAQRQIARGGFDLVQFGGGCVGCGMLSVTLKQGVEVAVKDQIPDIEEIVDITDHDQGDNPYYQPAKK